MHHLVNNVLKPLAILALAGFMAHCHVACKPAESPVGPLDVPYAAETLACTKAPTLAESHLCRANVNRKYGLCPDPTGVLLC